MSVHSAGRRRLVLGRIGGQALVYLVLLVGAVISLFPFYWMVSSSLKPSNEILIFPPSLFPSRVTFQAYLYVWSTMDVPRTMFNSVFVSTVQVTLNVFFSSLVAYSLAKLRFPGKGLLFLVVLALMILPGQIMMLPVFLQVNRLGMLDSYAGLILPGAVSSFTIFILRQGFITVPDEYIDAAIIDGARHYYILLRIAYPIIRPLLLTAALINFYWSWNSFLWPFLVISHDEMATLPVALARYHGFMSARWDAILAAATVVALPIVLLYLAIQRQFVESLAMTGLKG